MSQIHSNLTEEQKQKIKTLERSTAKNAAVIGLKFSFLLIQSNLVIILLDAFYVNQSKAFAFIGGIINGFFVFRSLIKAINSEKERIETEIKKILKD